MENNKYKNIDLDGLIVKFLSGEASPDEALNLEMWKSEAVENKKYYDQIANTYTLVSNTKVLENIDLEAAWEKNKSFRIADEKPKSTFSRYLYLIFGLLFLVSIFYFFLNNEKTVEVYNASEYALSETLNDGSYALLEPNSKITVGKDFGIKDRKVSLVGSAEFEVEHNEEIPFIVEVEEVFVEDLGTKFRIESSPESDTIFVVVEEGVVRLYDMFDNEIEIKAGEKAWYIRSQKTIIQDPNTKVFKFNFKKSTLSSAIDLITKAYEVNIDLEPNSIKDCIITTQFYDEDLETILMVITETLDFTYSKSSDKFTIKGSPCTEVE